MKRLKQWVVSVVCFPAALAMAQSETMTQPQHDGEFLFRADEGSIDMFGSLSVGQQTINHLSGDRVRDDGRLGAGLGLNYFLTRNIGFGADAYTENAGHAFVDNASGNLILRLPFDHIHLAPYIYGGGGHQFDPNELWFGQIGAGIDFRITKYFGLFADARYVLPEKIDNFGVARFGVRIAF